MEKLDRLFYEQAKSKEIPKRGDRILVCVSGGSDSVALFHLLHTIQKPLDLSLGICHLNHSFRALESDTDALFVKELAESHHLPYFYRKIDEEAWINMDGTGWEEKARIARYSFFQEIATMEKYSLIALGHTEDDLLETMLFNLFRGTSPQGLANLLPFLDHHTHLYRPLLAFSKQDILSYLKARKLPHREDSSNQDIRFTRNKLRNLLIPLIQEINPKAGASFLRFQKILQYDNFFIEEATEQYIKENAQTIQSPNNETEIRLPLDSFYKLSLSLKLRLIRNLSQKIRGHSVDFYFSQIKSIEEGIIDNKNFFYKESGMTIKREGDWIVFSESLENSHE